MQKIQKCRKEDMTALRIEYRIWLYVNSSQTFLIHLIARYFIYGIKQNSERLWYLRRVTDKGFQD